jgi:hypothetical protein
LVEPITAVHSAIRAYFERFAKTGALREISTGDVLGYEPQRRYDLVVAEGFIHTVKPESAWLAACARALVPGGFVLESHYEIASALVEISLKVPVATLLRHGAESGLAASERCYRTKWDRIPHTRSLASWVMDVILNPFQRPPTMCDAATLLKAADAAGFDLYSSWPMYADGLENVWSKRPSSRAEALERELDHVRHSVLSFVLGTRAYLVDEGDADKMRTIVDAAVADTDALIDADDPGRSARLAQTLRELAARARGISVLHDRGDAFERGLALLEGWARVHNALGRSNDDEAVSILNGDEVILDGWGNPNHLAVWRLRA